MADYKSIKVTKGLKTLEIDNPTDYPLIGMGAQGAVFKISEEKCVKIYTDPLQAKMEAEALKAGQHLSFFPRVFKTGSNFIEMEYFNAPTLKEYLRNCTYIPESITKKLLDVLREMKKTKFTMLDAPLRHIFVLENEELKLIDHVNAFKRNHPIPLKLLRDLNIILLKESFLSQVKKLEPETFETWQKYFNENSFDYKNIPVYSGGSGKGVKVESSVTQTLIGSGHQGAVYRVAEDKCVKIYGKPEHAKQEKEVLMSNQKLPFIPKVYETGSNYVLMEYLVGPDLNTFLKKQSSLSNDIARRLLDILTTMKKNGFKQIDAPLRHIIVTNNGFKLVDHVYSFSRVQERPIELFQNLHERGFLDSFLEQVKEMDPKTHEEWTKSPIPLINEQGTNDNLSNSKKTRSSKKVHDRKKGHDRKKENNKKKDHDHKKVSSQKKDSNRKKDHERKKGQEHKKDLKSKKGSDRRK
ncbi:putative Ser/Thr protein kinase [Bacillus sp. SORGH_AS 510]|uniref:hypothetical protein n=1 Tax=Bacillus sp. SORGH_AS_0510 TaxID=3041771 RepID=UPI00278685F4|nr:hypothetical protein [Bacillus sp. SORGH_AS_0510]MDQ1145681.1 putative Ser/Thr protein kinase [Bacillus sp. SORGH_AS_0510]